MSLIEQWQERAFAAEKRIKQALEMLRGSSSTPAKRAIDVLKGKYEIKTPEEGKQSEVETVSDDKPPNVDETDG